MKRSTRTAARPSDEEAVRTYLASVPPATRKVLSTLRRTILAAIPDAEDGFGYGIPAVRLHGRPLVYYAAFKEHCSFFPASKAVLAAHAEKLGRFQVSKGTIRFDPRKPLPVTLVRSIARARAAELTPTRRKR